MAKLSVGHTPKQTDEKLSKMKVDTYHSSKSHEADFNIFFRTLSCGRNTQRNYYQKCFFFFTQLKKKILVIKDIEDVIGLILKSSSFGESGAD